LRIDYFVPIAIKTQVALQMDAVKHLLPSWVNILTIRWDESNKEDVATATPQYEYRGMTIALHPLFLEDPDPESSLIHEICHGILRPYIQMVDRIVEKSTEGAMRDYLMDALADKEEEICEDLAVFAKKLKNHANV